MRFTMRVHSLTLTDESRQPVATLYRFDDVKRQRTRGWTDRFTIPAGDLALGDVVHVTIERVPDRAQRRHTGREVVTPDPHNDGTVGESEEDRHE